MEALSFNNLTVGDDGRVSFGGLSSGLDFQTIVEGIITARRIPIDSLETRITENSDKIAALQGLRSLLNDLKSAVADLRGAVTLGQAGDVFSAKQVFASTSRSDGTAPSSAGNLLGVSTSNAAALGSHSLEVLRVASAHKVASNSIASDTSALSLSGAFEVTGSTGSATITVQATDTLRDIRDRVNNANTGTNGTGVTASIVQASTNQFILVLTADDTGETMAITDSGSVLSGLGISSSNGTASHRNGLAAANSKIDAGSGFKHILFDGAQGDASFLISYDQASKVMTLTRGDGVTDTATLSGTAISTGKTETASFSKFGATIFLDDLFDKTTDILIDADIGSVTGGTGAIDAGTIKISDSSGDISGIASTTLTFGNLGDKTNISISAGAFSGSFDGSATGVKTVTLSDGSGNALTIQFDVTTEFDETETAASIDLQELENLVVSNGAPYTNQLQAPRTARFTADGLIDLDRFESNFIASGTAALTAIASGTFDLNVGADQVTVSFDNTDTLTTLVGKINAAITTAGAGNAVFDAGSTASAMTDGDGFRLVITDTSGAAITLTDTDGLLAELGVDNDLVIERSGNTVSDLFNGVTLTLFQAEEGTTVKLDVEQDLGAAKVQILTLIEAYNAVQASINQHGLVDSTTGAVTEDTGALFGSTLVGNVQSQLAQLLVTKVAGVGVDFSILAQIGVTLIDRDQQDPLLESTLQVDEAILDDALLNDPDEVRRLFAFDFTSSDSRISLLGFTGATSHDAAGYKINLNFDDRFQSQTFTDGGAFTQVDAITGGPAGDGIGAIAFDDSIVSGKAYRYNYDAGGGELLTLTDLASGTSETIDITAILDAAAATNGPGGDLAGSETATVNFASHKVTLTLNNGFTRATLIADGSLDVSGLDLNTTMTNGAVTTPVSGMDTATVDALKAAGAYDAATGLLTLGVTSNAAGEVHFDLAAGIKFRVDGGSILSDITGVDLDDLGAHGVEVYVNDGVSDVLVATLSFDTLAATAAGSGSLTVDLGTGLLAQTSTVASQNAPLENYLGGVVNGSFEVRDSTGALLGTVAYDKTESLTDLASNITANVTDVTASVIASGNTYKIEILHNTRDTLSFTADSDGLIAALNISNAGDGVFSANIGGAATGINDGSVTVSGRTLTATSLTKAEGLKVYYGGGVDLAGVQVDHTVGFGAQLYFELDKMLDNTTGTVVTEIDALGDRNTLHQSRVDDMLARLELRRQNLLDRFVALEAALLRAQNLRESLKQTFDAMFASQSS